MCERQGSGHISAIKAGPPVQVEITCQGEAGIASMSVYRAENATVDIPYYHYGTTDPVIVTGTKIDPTKPSIIQLELVSPNSCRVITDPVLTVLQIPEGKFQVRETFMGIPAAEHFITIQNSHPGLRRLRVLVNDKQVAALRLGPKNVKTLDVSREMLEGENTITLIGDGRPGAKALVVISDTSADGLAKTSGRLPVAWSPASWQSGVNMQWGGGAGVM